MRISVSRRFTSLIFVIVIVMLVSPSCSTPPTALDPTIADPTPSDPTPPPEKTLAAEEQPESTLAPRGTPEESYYAPFPVAITMDGSLEDWEGVPRVTIPEGADEVTGSTSVTFAAAADDTFLYLLGEVTDPKVISGEHGENYWNEDSLEFYLNATGNLRLTSYRDGVVQVTIPPLNSEKASGEKVFGGVNHAAAEPAAEVVRTETGYLIEAAFPLETEVWSIQPAHGGVLGFQVHLNGAATTSRNMKVIWSKFDQSDASYYDPSVFGELVFYRIGETEPVRVEPEPPPPPVLIEVEENALYKQADAEVAERVEDLLTHMTLAEKVGQMTLVEKNSIREEDLTDVFIGGLLSGGGGYPRAGNSPEAWAEMVDGFQGYALDSHLGIPLIYGVDAVHGHSNLVGAVIFPHNIGLGAANDPALTEEIGRVTALEMAATGIYWNYAPGVMVPQDIRWGRTYEGYSEDPDRVAALGAAYLQGLQSPDLLSTNTVIGTPKHYVGDGGTAWGSSKTGDYQIDQGVTEVDEAVLREIHLPPYQAAIEAGARSIMISFSSWGGEKMHGQEYLITDVLKGELGFTGFVVSDWGGIDQVDPDYYQAVVRAINAGIDMNMVPHQYLRFINTLTEAVEAGDMPMSRIDDAVRRILTVKFEMGLFEQPFSQPELINLVGSAEHRALARDAVAKSLVLLKNEGELLPLSDEVSQIFVAGSAADDIGIQSGGWTIEWQGKTGSITPGTTVLEGIQEAAGEGVTVEYSRAGLFAGDPASPDAVCLGIVGELPYAEGRGDSPSLNLPPGENRVLRRLEEDCRRLIVILVSGRPLIITDDLEKWDGLVAAWLPGSEGAGVADVLFGQVPFSGTLPYTWPATTDQIPLGSSTDPPLFPYGFGLETEIED